MFSAKTGFFSSQGEIGNTRIVTMGGYNSTGAILPVAGNASTYQFVYAETPPIDTFLNNHSIAKSGNIIIIPTYNSGAYYLIKSTNGGLNYSNATWQSNLDINFGVTSGNGVFFVGGVNSGLNYSTDNGNSWTQAFNSRATGTTQYLNNIYVSSGTSSGATTWFRVSTGNLTSWTYTENSNNSATTNAFIAKGAAYASNTYVFVGTNDGYGDINMAYSTDNCTSWTFLTTDSNTISYRDVAYGNGKFVATPTSGSNYAYSSDGQTWTTATSPISAGRVIYTGTNFLMMSANKAATSTDGITWTTQSTTLGRIDTNILYVTV